MTLQSSGAISLANIQTEFGGANPIGMNEYYAGGSYVPSGTGSIPTSGQISMNQFYGTSNAGMNAWPSMTVDVTHTHATATYSVQCAAFFSLEFTNETANNRIKIYYFYGTNAAAATTGTAYLGYTGLSSATWTAKVDHANGMTTASSSTTLAPVTVASGKTIGTYYSVPTSGSTQFLYKAQANYFSQNDTQYSEVSMNVASQTVTFTLRAVSGSTTYTKTFTTGDVALGAYRLGGGGGGGGCPLCCVHDSMLVATGEDMKSIYDIQIGDMVLSHNFNTGQDELVEVTDLIIVDRDVDYKVNDLIMTEDHPVYLQDGRKASVNPEATKINYKQEVDQLVIGDRMMKLDGTLEEIVSIEKYEGNHKNFAVQTKHNNFYANGHLVDSVIDRNN